VGKNTVQPDRPQTKI